jgi:hypothetical protein
MFHLSGIGKTPTTNGSHASQHGQHHPAVPALWKAPTFPAPVQGATVGGAGGTSILLGRHGSRGADGSTSLSTGLLITNSSISNAMNPQGRSRDRRDSDATEVDVEDDGPDGSLASSSLAVCAENRWSPVRPPLSHSAPLPDMYTSPSPVRLVGVPTEGVVPMAPRSTTPAAPAPELSISCAVDVEPEEPAPPPPAPDVQLPPVAAAAAIAAQATPSLKAVRAPSALVVSLHVSPFALLTCLAQALEQWVLSGGF